MPNLPDVVLWSIPAFVLLTVLELVSYRLHPDEDAAGYETRDAATSIGMGAAEAGRLGIDYKSGQPVRMGTANGVVPGWRVRLAAS